MKELEIKVEKETQAKLIKNNKEIVPGEEFFRTFLAFFCGGRKFFASKRNTVNYGNHLNLCFARFTAVSCKKSFRLN